VTPASAWQTVGKDVEPPTRDPRSDLEGSLGPRLPQHGGHILNLIGGLELETGRVEAAEQGLGIQWRYGHAGPPAG
jgi:hypothetical protein